MMEPGHITAVNEDPNRRDGYVELERDGECKRIILAPGERKRVAVKAGVVLVRWTIGTRVTT